MDGSFPSEKGADFQHDTYGGRGRGDGGGRGGFKGTAENAKTRMCNRWMQGECKFGDRCNFAHGDHELRPLPPREGFQSSGPAPRGRGPMGYGGRAPGGRFGPGRGGYGGNYGNPAGGYGGGPGGGGYGGQGGYGMEGQAVGGYGAAQPWQEGGQGHGQNMGMYPAPAEGPNGWLMYRDANNNEPYYHNQRTGATTWDRPAEWMA